MRKKAILTYSLLVTSMFMTGLYVLLFTATGFSWYLNNNIGDNSNGFEITSVSHSLQGTSHLTGLKYTSPFIQIEFTTLELNWNLFSLLNQDILISSFKADRATIKTSKPLTRLPKNARLPFKLTIEQGSIRELKLLLALASEKHQAVVRQVKLEYIYLQDNFYANNVVFNNNSGGVFKVSGKAGVRDGDVINLITRATFTLPGTGRVISSHGTIVGTTDKLNYLQNIQAPYAVKLSGSVTDLFSRPYWQFKVTNVSGINSEMLKEHMRLSAIEGFVNGEGFSNELHLSAQLSVQDVESRTWNIDANSNFQDGITDFNLKAQTSEGSDIANLLVLGNWKHNKGTKFLENLNFTAVADNFTWALNKNDKIFLSRGNIKFDGSSLNTNIKASELTIGSTGTHITDLTINSKSKNDKFIAMSGKALTNDGSISFSGDLEKSVQGYRIDHLSITGQNFALLRKPKAHIIISPDITLARVNQSIQSKGSIKIPTANIQLTGVEDSYCQLTRLIFHEAPTHHSGQTINRLDIQLGKSVWLHGYGLNAHVTGELSLVDLTHNQLLANGKLNVLRGNYKNSDEGFLVSGGTLSFNKKRLDNPQLDLKVVSKHRNSRAKPKVIQGHLQSLYGAYEKASNNSSKEQTGKSANHLAYATRSPEL